MIEIQLPGKYKENLIRRFKQRPSSLYLSLVVSLSIRSLDEHWHVHLQENNEVNEKQKLI
jgi:hypothetical protein